MDKEDTNKRRKSSILKPQKSRKPLCDLDLGNEDSDDTANMNKTCRRVSFASNNFIKPFVADPEKNTIWDLTYEEAIEHSGSSQSIKIVPDNKENECSPLNVTMFDSEDVCELDITSPVGRIETNTEVEVHATFATNYNVEDMELTTGIDFNAQCIIINDRNEDRCGDMEFTVPISNFGIISSRKENNPEMGLTDMEFTVPISNFGIISSRNENNPEMGLTDMEFTVPISNFKIISSENKNNPEISLADMEFTTAISGAILSTNRTNIENVDMSFDLTCDDTEKLINYDLSGAKTSDFSKVIAGDLEPSFPNLPAMPLRGINSTSFVQSLPSEIRSCEGSRDVSNMSMPSMQDKENCVNQSMEMDITCDNNEIEINCEDTEINKQCEGPIMRETQNKDVLDKKEEYSIVELCARLSEGNTSLLCDMSTISMDDPSMQSQDDNKDDDAIILAMFDEIQLIDVRQFEEMANRSVAINELVKKVAEKVINELNESKALLKKQTEIYNERKRLLDEFDSLRLKFEDACSSNFNTELAETSNREPDIITWKDQILTLLERNNGCWNAVSMEGNPYKFNTLYGTLDVILELNEENGQVLKMDLEDHISESSATIALYIHKIFTEKLKLNQIQSALGEKFEVLSLLDYIHLTMEKLLEIDRDFSLLVLTYGVGIDNDFKITFNLISIPCMFVWEFTIDVNDYDNINSDMVSFHAKIGDLKERDINKCMKECPKGFAFVKAFVTALYNFKDSLEMKL